MEVSLVPEHVLAQGPAPLADSKIGFVLPAYVLVVTSGLFQGVIRTLKLALRLPHCPLFSSASTVTTADAVALGPTVHAHVLALTVAAHRLGATRPHPSSPTSSPRPATMAIATQNLVAATAAAGVEVLDTKGSARALDHDPVPQSK